MRRLVPIALAALLTIGLVSPVAAGGRPDIIELEPFEFTIEGACDFDVHLVDTFANSRVIVFPEASDGTQRVLIVGGFESTLTRVGSDSSIDVRYFGRAELIFDVTTGTAVLRGSGQALLFLQDPVEAAFYGLPQGLYLVTGRVTGPVDGDLIATGPMTIRGTVRDLCAELAA